MTIAFVNNEGIVEINIVAVVQAWLAILEPLAAVFISLLFPNGNQSCWRNNHEHNTTSVKERGDTLNKKAV